MSKLLSVSAKPPRTLEELRDALDAMRADVDTLNAVEIDGVPYSTLEEISDMLSAEIDHLTDLLDQGDGHVQTDE